MSGLVVAVCVVVASCSGNPSGAVDAGGGSQQAMPDKPSGKVSVRLWTGMQTSDPFQDVGASSWNLLRSAYEGLTALDEKLVPQPMLAKSWKVSDDAKTYTFALRDDVLFHNDKPMAAADVKYSLDYYRAKSLGKANLSSVESVDVVDEHTVAIHLKRPSGGLAADLANPIVVPIVPTGSADGGNLATTPIGTGPYRIESFEPQVRGVLKPFAGYKPLTTPAAGLAGRKVALIDTLEFLLVADDQVAAAGLETGEFDLVPRVPTSDIKRFSSLPGAKVLTGPGSGSVSISMNLGKGPLSDPRIRQAITYAIDKSAMLDVTAFGFGRIANSFHPPEVNWYLKDAEDYWPYAHDPEKAKKLLAEAGYDGQPIVVFAGSPPYQEQNAVILQQQANAVGLKLTVQKMDQTTFITRTANSDYQMSSTGSPFRASPDLFYNQYYCGGGSAKNQYGYCDPSYDAGFEKASATIDQAQRNQLFAGLEKKLKDDAVILPLYINDVAVGVSNKISGFTPNVYDWLIVWNVWISS
jgi:peptide/nickel transport system substrate-binding protein